MSYLTSRAYYKARILIVPLGPTGDRLITDMVHAGLAEVQIATPALSPGGVVVRDINARAAGTSETVGDLVASVDMMVFLGSDLTEVPDAFVTTMATTGRNHGTLLAGVLVAAQGWKEDPGSTSMVVLRRELDMLVSVREMGLAKDFVEVLKGGTDEAVPGTLFQRTTVGS